MSARPMALYPPIIEDRARALELLVLDVDGVLTDGRLHYGPAGEEVKVFHAKDGLGLKLLQEDGVQVGVISARRAPALERRLADLGIAHVFLGRNDKRQALRELAAETGVAPAAMAFMGDDLLDLPAMRSVGLGITPADGHFLVRRELAERGWITNGRGGHGAVREVADGLLAARGRLESVVEAHLAARGGE